MKLNVSVFSHDLNKGIPASKAFIAGKMADPGQYDIQMHRKNSTRINRAGMHQYFNTDKIPFMSLVLETPQDNCIQWLNSNCFLLLLILFMLLTGSMNLSANDFPEPLAIDDPLIESFGTKFPEYPFATGGYGELAWNYHCISPTAEDTWNLHTTVAFTPFRWKDDFAIAFYYGGWLLTAPFKPGDQTVNVLRFWMSAMEFDYGITMAAKAGPLHITFEYSRTSQHPLTPGWSEVSTDAVKLGVVFPHLRLGDFDGSFFLRGGYIDLFDFWQSKIPKPRLSGIITAGTESSYRLLAWLKLFLNASIDLNITRLSTVDVSGRAELGLRVGTGPPAFEIYLELSGTKDTEQILNQPTPSFLAGFGIRMKIGWP
jgi:hypothetical protein